LLATFGDALGEEYILDMNPNPDNDQDTPPPVRMVRPHGEADVGFQVPRPRGNKLTGWRITFSDQDGLCSGQVPGPPSPFPDFLSIRAIDTDPTADPNVGGAFGADTWKIGTFIEAPGNPAGGVDEPRLACLIKDKGDEFVGFFSMSFMYTVVIK